MIDTTTPSIKKYYTHPIKWAVKNKLRSLVGKKVDTSKIDIYDVGQDPRQGDGNVGS